MNNTIHIAVALLIGPTGQTLLVRKRNTLAFMQPGGKIEHGELPVNALIRELHEELNVLIEPAQAAYLGAFSAPAANEPGFQVHCELFRVQFDGPVVPAAEIEEAVWVDAHSHGSLELAPLTRDYILPIYLLP
ncbi:NUDIX hydrolase [Pseudomonas abieticivorans]|uniref:NUDIX hydrolase n=1 Tax=Pseudomonas abieticivorans TaxID=2931382 RepID=UPI0020C13225|nr:NUDIX domain-containing protein [Pseudomonas sp. PIA16]